LLGSAQHRQRHRSCQQPCGDAFPHRLRHLLSEFLGAPFGRPTVGAKETAFEFPMELERWLKRFL
jgi:hypothetical protein